MGTIKSYTTLEQSKILANILPIESADMMHDRFIVIPFNDKTLTPCWSLAALLDFIPQEIFDGEYIINITEGIDNRWVITYDNFENRNHSYYGLSTGADNLVDACVAMIEKLHEQKLL